MISDRDYLHQELSRLPDIKIFPTNSNFVFFRCPDWANGTDLRNLLIRREGLFVRECGNKIGSSSQFIRVAANPKEKTDLLIEGLKRAFAGLRRGTLVLAA